MRIRDETEFRTAQQRVERFHSLLLQLRRTARPAEFDSVAGGYRLEIERIQAEILEYLLRPSQTTPAGQAA